MRWENTNALNGERTHSWRANEAPVKHFLDYADERLRAMKLTRCTYCGGENETRDHVPSRVLLDEPFPYDLPVVGACFNCNNGFSSDEEYVACLIECATVGSTDPDKVTRPKVARILREKLGLRRLIEASHREEDGGHLWVPDAPRVRTVIRKLGLGHALFELYEWPGEPQSIWSRPFPAMSEEEISDFEENQTSGLYPEIGSQGFSRMMEDALGSGNGWVLVQEGRYRFRATVGDRTVVRVVIGEYLAAELTWP